MVFHSSVCKFSVSQAEIRSLASRLIILGCGTALFLDYEKGERYNCLWAITGTAADLVSLQTQG